MIVTWILPQTVIPGTAATMVIVCAMGIAVSSSSDLRRSYLLRVIHVVCVGLVAEDRVCCMHAEHIVQEKRCMRSFFALDTR